MWLLAFVPLARNFTLRCISLIGELKQTKRRQQQLQKTIGFMSKATALHVHHALQYISLTFTARLRRKTSQCDFLWRTWTCDDEISFFFVTWIKSLRIQLQEKSPILDKLNGFKKTQKSLKRRKFIFSATFSLPSSSSLLKFPVLDHRCHHGEKRISYFISHLDKCSVELNPLSPKSDQHQISPCNINAL